VEETFRGLRDGEADFSNPDAKSCHSDSCLRRNGKGLVRHASIPKIVSLSFEVFRVKKSSNLDVDVPRRGNVCDSCSRNV